MRREDLVPARSGNDHKFSLRYEVRHRLLYLRLGIREYGMWPMLATLLTKQHLVLSNGHGTEELEPGSLSSGKARLLVDRNIRSLAGLHSVTMGVETH